MVTVVLVTVVLVTAVMVTVVLVTVVVVTVVLVTVVVVTVVVATGGNLGLCGGEGHIGCIANPRYLTGGQGVDSLMDVTWITNCYFQQQGRA